MQETNVSQKEEKLPSWAWSLYAHASPERTTRWSHRALWWCASTSGGVFRIVTIMALLVTFCSLLIVLGRNWQILAQHKFLWLAGFGALFLLVKALLAEIALLVFGKNTLVGGQPYVNSLSHLVPQKARKVALVGQNLASRLSDETYPAVSRSLRRVLSRVSRGGKPIVEELWLVFQTPRALKEIHPAAAEHLRRISLPAIEKLQFDLKDHAERVKVGFHPAATLSMIVVDWKLPRALAVVTPKLQTTPTVEARLSFIARGEDYVAVAGNFEQFIFQMQHKGDYPGATWATLADAADKLKSLLDEAGL